jgi:putative membrane protein
MHVLINWLISTVVIMALAYVLPGVDIENWFVALVAALILGLINAILRPLFILLTLPVNILTLGLLTFVIDALLVMLAAAIIDGFEITSFWWALLFALLLSLIGSLFRDEG